MPFNIICCGSKEGGVVLKLADRCIAIMAQKFSYFFGQVIVIYMKSPALTIRGTTTQKAESVLSDGHRIELL